MIILSALSAAFPLPHGVMEEASRNFSRIMFHRMISQAVYITVHFRR